MVRDQYIAEYNVVHITDGAIVICRSRMGSVGPSTSRVGCPRRCDSKLLALPLLDAKRMKAYL